MRALTLLLAVSAAAVASGAAQAQDICLYGGPDAAQDLACGPAFVAQPREPSRGASAPARASAPSVAAESRITSGASRTNGAAQSRLLAGGRVAPIGPLLPTGYAPAPQPAPAWPVADAAYAYAPDASPPPPPPAFDPYVTGAGPVPASDAFAYAYESADGGAYAWRYETPQGPAWAYAYDTPEGWAYAYAYDTAPDGPPPAMIQAYAPPSGHGTYRGPYVEQHGGHYEAGADWRYAEERLFGAAYRQQLYLVQTYYRESEWVAVSAIPGRRYLCGGCVAGGPIAAPIYPVPGPRGGFAVSGGGFASGGFGAGGFASGGFASGGASSRASQSVSASQYASQTMQAQARATGNQTVIGGAPFAPPPGAPVPPWGPPAQVSGGNTANAYAGAAAAANSAANAGANAGRR